MRSLDSIDTKFKGGSSERKPTFSFETEADFKAYFQQWNINSHSFISETFYQALDNKFTSRHGRGVEFRPSSFPQCPVINWLKKVWYDNLGYNIAERSCSMDYYCDVGTTVHETVQFHMGDSGAQFGHYRCINPKCKHGKRGMNLYDAAGNLVQAGKLTLKNTLNNRCPKCKERMFYEELTVKYKGLKGHVDGVIKLPNGKYWIIDYKTSSMKKIMKAAECYPEKKHLYQLPIYAYILKKKYKFEVAGFSLIYIPRDNPKCFFEYSEKWSKRWDKHAVRILKTQKRQWEAFELALETNSVDPVIEHKPCKCERSYLKTMYGGFDHCPMKDICFGAKLKPALLKWEQKCKKQKVKDNTLAEAVKVITEKQRKEKVLGVEDKSKSKAKSKAPVGIARKPMGKVRVL